MWTFSRKPRADSHSLTELSTLGAGGEGARSDGGQNSRDKTERFLNGALIALGLHPGFPGLE